ncbi:MAG: hypothetical protein U1F42_07745 [Candidatus Competibacteraceae bacterium]
MAIDCPKVGDLPADYSSRLPRGVPPVERAPTSFPFVLEQAKTFGPADVTWYFPIALPKTNPTGVFIPQGFGNPKEVDVILYFHGNKLGEFDTINQYWSGKLHNIALRDDLNASGKRALLVAPTLGENSGHGMGGNPALGIFGTPGGGNCFLDHVMQWLGKYEPRYSLNNIVPQVRSVVLAGHSGGGNAIHLQMEAMKAKISEIWCFDVVYGDVNDWVDFARFNPTKRLTFYHAVQSLDSLKNLIRLKEVTEIQFPRSLDNLKIIKGGSDHFPCLTDNFRSHAKQSGLPNR